MAGAAMRVYDKVVHEQVFNKNVLFMNVLRNVAHDVGATTKYFSLHYDRNVGSAAGSETITLPKAGEQQYKQASVDMKYNFHTLAITDVSLKASQKSKEFLVNVLESEYEGAKNDMQRQLSRQGYSDGSGVIARVDGTGTDMSLDNPMVGKYPTDYLSEGNAIMTSNDKDSETNEVFTTISSIDDNNTITVADTNDSDDDYLFLAHNADSPDSSNQGNEITGLKGLIDDGSNVTDFQGLSRSTYNWWNSYVDDNSSQRSLTDAMMHDTFLEAKKKGNPKYILTHFDLYAAYGLLLTPDRRYTDTMELKGGFTGINFNNTPVVPDYDCPYDEMYFIDPSTLSVEDLAPMSFLNEDGAILDRSSTQPVWQATLRYYANLANKAPNKSAALRDVIK